jgi:hypothetical protein
MAADMVLVVPEAGKDIDRVEWAKQLVGKGGGYTYRGENATPYPADTIPRWPVRTRKPSHTLHSQTTILIRQGSPANIRAAELNETCDSFPGGISGTKARRIQLVPRTTEGYNFRQQPEVQSWAGSAVRCSRNICWFAKRDI